MLLEDMLLEDILGMPLKELQAIQKENIVAVNNVNSTIELKNIRCLFDNKKEEHHALFFFDLSNNDIMTMAVIKFESLSKFRKWRMINKKNIQCKGYIGCITSSGGNEVILAYIRENIIKAL